MVNLTIRWSISIDASREDERQLPLFAGHVPGGTASFHSTHTLRVPVPDVAFRCSERMSFGHTLLRTARARNWKATFPRPLPTGFLGSAKERPWYDIKRQEEGRSLAHPHPDSWPSRCAAASGCGLQLPPQQADQDCPLELSAQGSGELSHPWFAPPDLGQQQLFSS